MRRTAGHLLGAELHVVDDAGHVVLDEAMDRVASVVSESLEAAARVSGIKSA